MKCQQFRDVRDAEPHVELLVLEPQPAGGRPGAEVGAAGRGDRAARAPAAGLRPVSTGEEFIFSRFCSFFPCSSCGYDLQRM